MDVRSRSLGLKNMSREKNGVLLFLPSGSCFFIQSVLTCIITVSEQAQVEANNAYICLTYALKNFKIPFKQII